MIKGQRKIRGIRDRIKPGQIIGRLPGSADARGHMQGLTGAQAKALLRYLDSEIVNTSVVAGASVTDALTTLNAAILTAIADGDIISNISGGSAVPIGNTLTAILDHVFGSTKGMTLYRDTSVWKALAAGIDGLILTLASGVPAWAANTGGSASTALTFVNGGSFSIGAVTHQKADQTATLTTGQALRLAMMAPTKSAYGFAVVDPNNTAHGYLGNTQADGNVVTYRGTAGSTLALGATGNTGIQGAFGTAYHKQQLIFSHDGTNIGIGYSIDEGAGGCGQFLGETDANAIGRTGLVIGVACGGSVANIKDPYMNIATTIGGI